MNQPDEIKNFIKLKAKELGFLECAIVSCGFLSEEQEHLESWLSHHFYGEMGYMARNKEKRLDPRLLVENAKTIIMVLQNYFTSQSQTDKNAPVISKYAYGEDYHQVMKENFPTFLRLSVSKFLRLAGEYLSIRPRYSNGHGHAVPGWDG